MLLGLKLENGFTPVKIILLKLYKNSLLTKFLRRFGIEILETNIRIKTFYQIEFMNKLVNLEESSLDKIDYITVEFPTVERLLEGVIKVFLQFDSEYLIIPMECMPVYGIIPEVENRRPLTYMEKEWIFDHRQAWEHEKDLALIEGCPLVRFIAKQPNVIRDSLIKKLSVNMNSTTISLLKRIIRSSTQEKKREKKIKKLSKKSNNQNFRNIQVSISNKRIKYFLDEELIIKGSGSVEDPLR
jgi:hypothetical protein